MCLFLSFLYTVPLWCHITFKNNQKETRENIRFSTSEQWTTSRTHLVSPVFHQNIRVRVLLHVADFWRYCKDALWTDLPADAAAIVSGRLFVSLTDLTLRNHLVSEFANREELADALACSCFIPAFSGYRVPRFRGRRFLDGGLTNSLPAPPIPVTTQAVFWISEWSIAEPIPTF